MRIRRIVAALLAVLLLAAPAAAAAGPLRDEIYREVKAFDGKAGVYAKNLKTGRQLDINENTLFPTASTSKLVVAMAVYKYLYAAAPPDKRAWYDEGTRLMMEVSDNDYFTAILTEIDASKSDVLRRVTRDLGLSRTRIHDPESFRKYRYHSVTTAAEMAKVFAAIHQEKYLGREQSRRLKTHLANTIFTDEIPRFMQAAVMHKVGELDDVLCDVGIVDDGKDQILISIYTRTDRPVAYASDFIAGLSAKLYNELRRR
ncbi:MAG: serine hydrolase [Sporomusaceae bacterium]|nr:serine hydrolase [Sporomusaceae bacterium]